MPKREKSALPASKLASAHAGSEKQHQHALNREMEPLCFPALPDAYTNGVGIGLTGVLAGRRLKLGGRVLTGSWRRKDGTVREHYSRWVEYTRVVEGVPMDGLALVPESEIAMVMSFKAFAGRKAA